MADSTPSLDLAGVFQRAEAALQAERARLNQMDAINHNHGDHAVAIFHCASQAAALGGDLPQAMNRAAAQLHALPDNGSAQVYARGLECLARQLEERQVGLQDLLAAVRSYLSGTGSAGANPNDASDKGGEVMKALLHALGAWEKAENAAAAKPAPAGEALPPPPDHRGLDLGYLLGMGMAYLQAKQQGGDRLDVLAETVVSSSPLGRVPHRHASGVLAVRSLLNAMYSAQADLF